MRHTNAGDGEQKTVCPWEGGVWQLSVLCIQLSVKLKLLKKIKPCDPAQWLMPVIPALWEAEAGGQEFSTCLAKS